MFNIPELHPPSEHFKWGEWRGGQTGSTMPPLHHLPNAPTNHVSLSGKKSESGLPGVFRAEEPTEGVSRDEGKVLWLGMTAAIVKRPKL